MYPDKRARLEYQDRILARLLIEQMHRNLSYVRSKPFFMSCACGREPSF